MELTPSSTWKHGTRPTMQSQTIRMHLDSTVLKNLERGCLAHMMVIELLSVLAECRCEWHECTIEPGDSRVTIVLAPDSKHASRIALYIDDETIGISAGRGAYMNVPDDVEVPERYSTAQYSAKIVNAILGGYLHETVYSKLSRAYKWDFELMVENRRIALERTDLPRALLTFWARSQREEIVYKSVC